MRLVSYLRTAVCLLGLLLFVGCAKVGLYTNVEESEANVMMATLIQAGLDCDKSPGDETTWNLMVAKGDFARAVEILGKLGLPRHDYRGIGESFQKSGLISSPSEERIRFMHALSEEIAETISEIDGVLVARVHIVLPENDPFKKDQLPSSAAVFIKHHPDADLSGVLTQVRELVENSVEDLESDKVSVVMVPAEEMSFYVPPASIEKDGIVEMGGIGIARDSLRKFWVLAGGVGAVMAGLLALTAYFALRGRGGPPQGAVRE